MNASGDLDGGSLLDFSPSEGTTCKGVVDCRCSYELKRQTSTSCYTSNIIARGFASSMRSIPVSSSIRFLPVFWTKSDGASDRIIRTFPSFKRSGP